MPRNVGDVEDGDSGTVAEVTDGDGDSRVFFSADGAMSQAWVSGEELNKIGDEIHVSEIHALGGADLDGLGDVAAKIVMVRVETKCFRR